jgi:hypothetical protein
MDEKKERLRFQFSANRFLKGMVRLLVGNLLEVGQGRMSVEEFEHHLASGEAPKFMNLADPQGLYLSKVEYSFDTGHAALEFFDTLARWGHWNFLTLGTLGALEFFDTLGHWNFLTLGTLGTHAGDTGIF